MYTEPFNAYSNVKSPATQPSKESYVLLVLKSLYTALFDDRRTKNGNHPQNSWAKANTLKKVGKVDHGKSPEDGHDSSRECQTILSKNDKTMPPKLEEEGSRRVPQQHKVCVERRCRLSFLYRVPTTTTTAITLKAKLIARDNGIVAVN